ncbi:MAG: TraX family protein, partial [Anaerotignaceae bacterium]
FPIFAFQLAQGVKYTSDIKRYITRLFIFAIVSQPIYMINNPNDLNIIFDMIIGVVVIYTLMKEMKYAPLGIATWVLWSVFNKSYGFYGIATMVIFYFWEEDFFLSAILFVSLNIAAIFMDMGNIQWFAILVLPIIFYKNAIVVKLPKYLFYAYYPLHLLAINIINRI